MDLNSKINLIKRDIDSIKLRYFKGEMKLQECSDLTGLSKQTLKNAKVIYKKNKKEE